MAKFKLRLHLDQGQKGVRLSSLSSLANETQKFLKMLGEDVGIEGLRADWIASDFKNGSLSFNVESRGAIDEPQAVKYRRAVEHVAEYDPSRARRPPAGIRPETIVQFARISDAAETSESLRLGIYENGSATPEWVPITKHQATAVIEHFEAWTEFGGMVHGVVHSLYKESEPPYFDIRDISSGQLVKCMFPSSLYDRVIAMLSRKDAVVMVSGTIRARRSDKHIDCIRVERMAEAPTLSDDQFNRFFGSAPNITGRRSTSAHISRLR